MNFLTREQAFELVHADQSETVPKELKPAFLCKDGHIECAQCGECCHAQILSRIPRVQRTGLIDGFVWNG